MDPTHLLTMPAVIIHRAESADTVDEYGDPELEVTGSTILDGEPGVWGHQLTRADASSERGGLVNTDTEQQTVYLPPDVALGPRDAIVVANGAYEVDGPAWLAFHPQERRYTHWEATVKRVI